MSDNVVKGIGLIEKKQFWYMNYGPAMTGTSGIDRIISALIMRNEITAPIRPGDLPLVEQYKIMTLKEAKEASYSQNVLNISAHVKKQAVEAPGKGKGWAKKPPATSKE